MKVIIIGGVAGGASAAARIRRLDETAQIIVLERSNYVSYANCGMPYFIGGVIREQAELTLQTPQSFWERFHIDVRVRNEAVDIDVKRKTVAIRRLDTGEIYHEQYDKLLLSPGAKPVVPHLPGVTSDRIFSLRTVEDTLRIRKFIEEYKPATAVICDCNSAFKSAVCTYGCRYGKLYTCADEKPWSEARTGKNSYRLQ